MRHRFLGLLLNGFFAFVVIGFTACRPSSFQKELLGISLPLERRTLSNGLNVLLVPDQTVPIISYQTWYRVGSVDESPGSTGLAHLFEHLMFSGTPKFGARYFYQFLDSNGGMLNAFTTRDYTVFHEDFSPPLLEKVIDLESDRMAHLTIDEKTLNTEKMVVLEERRIKLDSSPELRMQEALWQLAYRRHPYQWPVVGYPPDVLGYSVAQVQEFRNAYFQPGNATVVLVGAFDPVETLKLLKKYYEPIEGRRRVKRDIPSEPEQTEERRYVLRERVSSERFAQAYHISAATDSDSYALDVLANILFEGSSSRARRRLINELDLVASVTGSAYTPTYPGLFLVNAVMKSGVSSFQAEEALWQVIREVKEKGVSQDEVQTAVRQLMVQLVDSIRTPRGLAQLLGTVQVVFGDPMRFVADLERYARVTPDDVKRVAQKYLDPNHRAVVSLMVLK